MINQGYQIPNHLRTDYRDKMGQNTFASDKDNDEYEELLNDWINSVLDELVEIFPTEMEAHYFGTQERGLAYSTPGVDQRWAKLTDLLPKYINRLIHVLDSSLNRYTDLPLAEQLYIEDIDSFQRARDVNPATVLRLLKNGYLDLPEDIIQSALERILAATFHKKDWGGEYNDLYTTNLIVNGRRVGTSFLLKGNGLRKSELTISDCGKNGDQIVRLFQSPGHLFAIQYVGRIAEALVSDALGKVRELRARNQSVNLLIIDGQDTARILAGYNELPQNVLE